MLHHLPGIVNIYTVPCTLLRAGLQMESLLGEVLVLSDTIGTAATKIDSIGAGLNIGIEGKHNSQKRKVELSFVTDYGLAITGNMAFLVHLVDDELLLIGSRERAPRVDQSISISTPDGRTRTEVTVSSEGLIPAVRVSVPGISEAMTEAERLQALIDSRAQALSEEILDNYAERLRAMLGVD